jgi:hypothetical protein
MRAGASAAAAELAVVTENRVPLRISAASRSRSEPSSLALRRSWLRSTNGRMATCAGSRVEAPDRTRVLAVGAQATAIRAAMQIGAIRREQSWSLRRRGRVP